MQLDTFKFEFLPLRNVFERFDYFFDVLPDLVEYRDGDIDTARVPYQALEKVLDEICPDFKKSQEDKFTEKKLVVDINYKPPVFLKHLHINYELKFDQAGKPHEARAYLADSIEETLRSLKIFDSVLRIPGLEISKSARLSVDRFNELRRHLPSDQLELKL